MDSVLGEASALSSQALSINFWRADGVRIEVKGLADPLHFSLEVSDPAATCAFWDEDVAKWSTDGTRTVSTVAANGTLECSTSHLTIFGGIKHVFLKNIVLALTCSTISTLLSGSAFARLQDTSWLLSAPSILNIVFHVLGVISVLLACLYDRKKEQTIPWEEREVVLMRVKGVDEKEQLDELKEEEAGAGEAPKRSFWTRCMGCFNHSLEYASHASGGDATLEALKEVAGNADTAAVNRAISTIQSHKSGIARAQISIFNQQHTDPELRKQQSRASIGGGFLLEDHGQAAAEVFLQRGWLRRICGRHLILG
eukprot:s1141_g24.t1